MSRREHAGGFAKKVARCARRFIICSSCTIAADTKNTSVYGYVFRSCRRPHIEWTKVSTVLVTRAWRPRKGGGETFTGRAPGVVISDFAFVIIIGNNRCRTTVQRARATRDRRNRAIAPEMDRDNYRRRSANRRDERAPRQSFPRLCNRSPSPREFRPCRVVVPPSPSRGTPRAQFGN